MGHCIILAKRRLIQIIIIAYSKNNDRNIFVKVEILIGQRNFRFEDRNFENTLESFMNLHPLLSRFCATSTAAVKKNLGELQIL